jgi:hypothetical protein
VAKVPKRTIVELSRDRVASVYWDDSLGNWRGYASVADNVVGGQVSDWLWDTILTFDFC